MSISNRRLIILFAFLTAWGLVVTARLIQIQMLRNEHYESRAAKQQERTLSLTPMRGSIRDSRGRILAESVTVESIYADPQAVADLHRTAKLLSSVQGLAVSEKELEKRLRGRGEFAWIARQVSSDVASAVRALSLPGIYLLEEHKRSYPKGSLAANVLGYVGVDGEGLAGVEYSFDAFVRGRAGKVTLLRDARRGMYLVGGEGTNAAVDGKHVVLTIDEVIQFLSERALQKVVEEHAAVSGSVIVMDPSDGAILAMASYPTFDPNRFREFGPDAWRNRPVQDQYEPGSTLKIVTAAAGLQEEIVTPSQILDCGPGYIEIANIRIREHDGHQYGLIPFEEVMARSSNVGTIRVAHGLGQERFYQYLRDFGFGERTGIPLPGEASGMLRNPRRWSKLSNAMISIGQEIAVTPLQLTRAAAIVANGGHSVEPRIVERVVDETGDTIYEAPKKGSREVISEKTAAILNEILKSVVTRGTGKSAGLEQYAVAGKTGTAQKPSRGGYHPSHTVASFVGYVPADRPELVILVVVDQPRGGGYGGTVAAPAFREIADGALRYLRVQPSLPERRIVLPPVKLAAFSQSGSEGLPVSSRTAAPAAGLYPVPDLRGLDGRTAVARATAAGYRVRALGSGRVIEQAPAAGTPSNVRNIELMMAPVQESGT